MKKLLLLATVATLAAFPAKASTIGVGTLTSDHCTGGCGPQTGGFGTITVTDNGLGTGGNLGTLAFVVQLINGNNFVTGGQDVTFGFDLAGNPTLNYTVSPFSPDLAVASWSVVGGNPQAAGTLHADGFGNVEYGVKLAGSGNSPPRPDSLAFSISGINLDITDLQTIMVADIFSGTTGNTGFVDFTGNLDINPVINPVPTPIAGSGWLFVSGLAGLWGLHKRRQKKLNRDLPVTTSAA